MPATTPVTLKLLSAFASERAGEGQQPCSKYDRSANDRHETAHAAEQAGKREGTQTRSALMIGFLARLPAAFKAYEQTDGQCDGEAAKQLFLSIYASIILM